MTPLKLIAKLRVTFIYLFALQILSETTAAASACNSVRVAGNASAADRMGLTVGRRHRSSNNDTDESVFRVVGGYRPEDKSLLKYLVSLRTSTETKFFGDNHFCGGAIVSKRLIVTAAHCVFSDASVAHRPGKVLVVAGTPKRLQRADTTQVLKVNKIKWHPRFSIINKLTDIAVLKLKEDINIDGKSADVIELSDEAPTAGTACTVIGWGAILKKGPLPDEAVYGDKYIQSRYNCKKLHFLHPSLICANYPPYFDVDTCNGDSGGPLICKGKLAGIASFGFGCAAVEGVAGFYANVYYFRDWIKENRASARSQWPLHSSVVAIVFYILYSY